MTAEVGLDRATRRAGRPIRPTAFLTIACLLAALAGAVIIALTMGAAGIPLTRLPAALGYWPEHPVNPLTSRDQLVLWSIRIPRIAAAAMVGSLLAASGAVMQGLFRNPLADPALVGVSSGGAFAAAAAIVFTDSRVGESLRLLQNELLPIAAFTGSLATTVILYGIASRAGRTSIAIFLLAGLAIAAIANAGIGLLVFMADDRQLRDITFWLLGSLSGATWAKTATIAPVLAVGLAACLWIARGLDVLVLGEAEAFHSGVDVERLKRISIVLVSAMTGVAVSVCGVVGFVGIVVPHLLRLVIGPAHRLLLPASALLGAVLLVGEDGLNPVPGVPPAAHAPAGSPIVALPYAPHSELMPRASAIVHQGGVGTTAAAMRAGRPMLVVPFSHDQPDNAERLRRHGLIRQPKFQVLADDVGPHKGLDELAYPPPADDSVQPIVNPLINGDGQFLLHGGLLNTYYCTYCSGKPMHRQRDCTGWKTSLNSSVVCSPKKWL